jgi:hypothetical protein
MSLFWKQMSEVENHPEFAWVAAYANHAVEMGRYPKSHEQVIPRARVEREARRRYSAVRRAQIVWVSGAVLLLLGGFASALLGLTSGHTESTSVFFWLTACTLPATFTLIALGAVRELVEDLAKAEHSLSVPTPPE